MLRTLLICGMLAGFAGGMLATAFAEIAGEPAVNAAIAYEDRQAGAAAEPTPPELVPRGVQRTFGLLTGVGVYGTALGGLFALVFALAYGRVRRASPARTALWLAAGAFLVVYLIPFVKYPANPPSIGNPGTLHNRTLIYLSMTASSILLAVAAVRAHTRMLTRVSVPAATLLAAAGYLVAVIAVGIALPGLHEVPRSFPAVTLWRFREAAVGMQLVLWSSTGLIFAALAQRVMAGEPAWWRRAPRPS